VAGVGVKMCTVQDLMGKINLEDLGVDGWKLKQMLKKHDGGGGGGEAQTGSIHLMRKQQPLVSTTAG